MIISASHPGALNIRTKKSPITLSDQVQIGEFTLSGPGEYEVSGIEVLGVGQLYIFESEDMRLAYLDKLNRPLSTEEQEAATDVDILFVPVGGGEVLDTKGAIAVINQLDPRIVIPMHYHDISDFSKQEGIKPEQIDSLKITKAELPENERRVIILPWKQSKKSST